jgi:hypothetical protein
LVTRGAEKRAKEAPRIIVFLFIILEGLNDLNISFKYPKKIDPVKCLATDSMIFLWTRMSGNNNPLLPL